MISGFAPLYWRGKLRNADGSEYKPNRPQPRAPRPPVKEKFSTYAAEAIGTGMIKIGKARQIELRIRDLQQVCPVELKLFAKHDDDIESSLHELLRSWRSHGEWFRLDDESRSLVLAHMQPIELTLLANVQATTRGRGHASQYTCHHCKQPGHSAKTCWAR